MNTTKGVVQAIARSPTALASTAVVVSSTAAVLFLIFRSQTFVDDAVLLLVLLQLLAIVYLQPDFMLGPIERMAPEVVWRIPTQLPMAALTIDDLPLLDKPTSFEEILDVLAKHKVRATLFVMSGFADLREEDGGMEPSAQRHNLELLQRAAAEGHELANHLQFDKPAIAMTNKDFDHAFLHCDSLLAELAGGRVAWQERPKRWFRPASAMWSKHMLKTAQLHGYTTVICNCFPFDPAPITRFVNAAYLACRVRAGAVVVLHDRWHTPATLDKALPRIAAQGIKLCTLSELHSAVVGDSCSYGQARSTTTDEEGTTCSESTSGSW
mmetsp:Transcript_115137/g.360235  ORF Transcript_115137/g.360235 Transcript_115137/m.360235 type:complete len:325 (-) Transcript_115137:121-1095(-)